MNVCKMHHMFIAVNANAENMNFVEDAIQEAVGVSVQKITNLKQT